MDELLYLETGPTAPNNAVYDRPRLEGGVESKQDDDLKDALEVSDVEDSPKNIVKFKPQKPDILPEKPKHSKWSLVIKYSKAVVLILIILTAIILLARVNVRTNKLYQIVVEADKFKRIEIDGFDAKNKLLGIELTGPFLLVYECVGESGKALPSVHLHLTVNKNGVESLIGDTWKNCLVDPSQFDTVKPTVKNKVFNLNDYEIDGNVFLNMQSKDLDGQVCLSYELDTTPVDVKKGVVYGIIVLVFLYVMIVTEIIDRTFASLIAAALSLGILALCNAKASQNELITWIDVETLALLVGMMLLVSILAQSGIFDYFAVFAYKMAKGRVWPLINFLSFFTAILATFLDSVTMMLLATPVTIRLCEVLSLDPVPVLICMVLFANVGAAMTPVGDPPNVIITLNPFISKSNVNFGNFVLHMLVGVVFGLIQTYIHVRVLYRNPKRLHFKNSKEIEDLRHEIALWERTAAGISPYSQDEDVALETIRDKIQQLKTNLAEAEKKEPPKTPPSFEETLAHLTEQYPLRDKTLLIKASVTFIFVLIMFIAHSVPGFMHVSLGWSALIGAFLLLIISDRRDLEALLVRIEWSTLLFFAALFIVMESLSVLGVIDHIGTFVVHVISSVEPNYQLALAIVIVVWVSGIASAFLDNIPVTTMMVKIIIRLSQDSTLNLPLHPLVWSLAFGACFGGNGTLIGASANVVTAGVAEQHGYKISFIRFFIVCFPIMLGNLFVATVYLLIAHVALTWH